MRVTKEKHPFSDAFEIRKMEVEDLAAVLEIEEASFISPWTEGMFEETLDSSISEGFVLTAGRSLLGYIILYAVEDEGHIMNIAVEPSALRKGIASMLVAHVISRFREKGVSQFFLEVREGNEPAKKLYRKLGFGTIGRRKRYYTETNEDALVMWLSIC
jgi:[ribosomal protein S18]-alanine N-acetyltransferase